MDDIIVYSKTYEEHVKNLVAVLGKLMMAGFTIYIDKCDFCKQSLISLQITGRQMPVIHDMDNVNKV